MNLECRLGSRIRLNADTERHRTLGHRVDAGRPFTALAVKDRNLIADCETQYTPEITRTIAFERQLAAVDQLTGNK